MIIMDDSDAMEMNGARNERGLFIAAAILSAGASLGLAYYGMAPAFVGLAFGALFARMAVNAQHRADAIFARALAADLAEGVDDPTELSEAA